MNPFATIKDIQAELAAKKISHEELIKFFQDRLERYNPILNTAISQLKKNSNDITGPLSGAPCIIKDNVCLKDLKTTAGSKILDNFYPTYNASIIDKILQSGGTILGKANMDEFAMGGSGEFSAFGPTKNPWNLNCSPGGSSAGVAAAVAAGLVPWGIATETGGSIRQPAAFCGLVGMFPSYGRVSRNGLIPFGSSLDQPGPITRTVYDAAVVMSCIAGQDPLDSTSSEVTVPDYLQKIREKLPASLKIGVISDSFAERVHPEIKAATQSCIKNFEKLGVTVELVDIPSLCFGISVYFVISRAEAASNLAKIDGSLYGQRSEVYDSLEEMYLLARNAGFGSEVKRRILLGNFVLSSSHRDIYEKANIVRNLIRRDLNEAFEKYDLLLSPTTPVLPFLLNSEINDPLTIYLCDYFYLPNCVAGYPAISFPTGLSSNGLPLSCQLIGSRFREDFLLQVAYAYEQINEFANIHPLGFD